MPNADFLSTPELNYEQWRDLLRPNWGLYTPDDPKAFAGRVRSQSICGFNASDIGNNIRRCERTQSDARVDGVDHCYAVFQIAGRSTLVQSDRAVALAVGDLALINSARPVTYVNDGHEQWLSLQLPRQLLTSHLGFEPQGGFRGRPGTRAGRLLFQLVLDAADDEESMSTSAGNYMQLAVYDLLGSTIRTVKSSALLPSCGQAVLACLRHHQGSLCRSRSWPLRGGRRSGDFAALSAEAVHAARLQLQPFHLFGAA